MYIRPVKPSEAPVERKRKMADLIVVGCGFAGAVIARNIAESCGKKVLLLEKRPQIGGNMADSPDEAGVLVHRYGPHIFHTADESVYRYLSRFTQWRPYRHRVLGRIDGSYVPIPFNFTSLETLLPDRAPSIEKCLLTDYAADSKVPVTELLRHRDEEIRRFGEFVFEKVFLHYTSKMWGMAPEKVDRSVLGRVPVVLGHGEGYFSVPYQAMPSEGYTRLFERLLDHPLIEIELSCDADRRLTFDAEKSQAFFDGQPLSCPVVYTGALDGLLGYRFGALPYRSLDMKLTTVETDVYQPAAVVNYPNDEAFTRITEFKWMTGQKLPGVTTVLREYPRAYDHTVTGMLPYYPIAGDDSRALYEKYRGELARYGGFYLCGRLAEYRYYDMDAAVKRALEVSETIRKDSRWETLH